MHDIDRRLAAQNQYRILALTLGVYTVQQREAGTCINQLSTKSLTRCTCVLLPKSFEFPFSMSWRFAAHKTRSWLLLRWRCRLAEKTKVETEQTSTETSYNTYVSIIRIH